MRLSWGSRGMGTLIGRCWLFLCSSITDVFCSIAKSAHMDCKDSVLDSTFARSDFLDRHDILWKTGLKIKKLRLPWGALIELVLPPHRQCRLPSTSLNGVGAALWLNCTVLELPIACAAVKDNHVLWLLTSALHLSTKEFGTMKRQMTDTSVRPVHLLPMRISSLHVMLQFAASSRGTSLFSTVACSTRRVPARTWSPWSTRASESES